LCSPRRPSGPSQARLTHNHGPPRALPIVPQYAAGRRESGGEARSGLRHLARQGGDPRGAECRREAVLGRGRRASLRRVHTDRINAFCCRFFLSISAEYCLVDKAVQNRAFRLLPVIQPLHDTPVFPKPENLLLHFPIQVAVIHGQAAWTSGSSLRG